jgi:hypothetical protein
MYASVYLKKPFRISSFEKLGLSCLDLRLVVHPRALRQILDVKKLGDFQISVRSKNTRGACRRFWNTTTTLESLPGW